MSFRSLWNERHSFTFCYNQNLQNFSCNFLVVSFTLLICSRMSISQSSAFIPTNKILFIIHFNSSNFFLKFVICRKVRNKKEKKKGQWHHSFCYRFWQGKWIIYYKCLWPQNNIWMSKNVLPKFICIQMSK